MIYRFSARQVGSERTIEVQLQAPAGQPVDKLNQALRTSFSQQGLELDSLQYVGSTDTNFEGIVVPKCAAKGCEKTVDTPGGHCEECSTGTIHGWYSPIGNGPAKNMCVVQGCGQESTFHLCKKHASPGLIVEVGSARKFVISLWLVERANQMRLISMNDYSLGTLFSGREAFENRLHEQGYKIHHLISRLEQLETAKRLNTELRFTLWSPDLPDDEDDVHDGIKAAKSRMRG
jgi:hypothetical protein